MTHVLCNVKIELCHQADTFKLVRSESSNSAAIYKGYSDVFNMQAVFFYW